MTFLARLRKPRCTICRANTEFVIYWNSSDRALGIRRPKIQVSISRKLQRCQLTFEPDQALNEPELLQLIHFAPYIDQLLPVSFLHYDILGTNWIRRVRAPPKNLAHGNRGMRPHWGTFRSASLILGADRIKFTIFQNSCFRCGAILRGHNLGTR